jgi:hypothetical protein
VLQQGCHIRTLAHRRIHWLLDTAPIMVYSTGADEALQANKAGTEPQVERLARYLDLSKPDRTAVLDWVLVLLT